jgi:hypothetical protein
MLLSLPAGLPSPSTLQSNPLQLKQFRESNNDRTKVKKFSRLPIIAEAWVRFQANTV